MGKNSRKRKRLLDSRRNSRWWWRRRNITKCRTKRIVCKQIYLLCVKWFIRWLGWASSCITRSYRIS